MQYIYTKKDQLLAIREIAYAMVEGGSPLDRVETDLSLIIQEGEEYLLVSLLDKCDIIPRYHERVTALVYETFLYYLENNINESRAKRDVKEAINKIKFCRGEKPRSAFFIAKAAQTRVFQRSYKRR